MHLVLIIAAVLGIVLSTADAVRYAVTHKQTIVQRLLLGCGVLLFSSVMAAVIFVNICYKADAKAMEYIRNGTDAVTVSEISGGYLFDGPGTEDLLIFYPGARVEAEAYAPLLGEIAEQGVDCALAVMPLRLSLFNISAADGFLSLGYPNNYIGGHSLGGTAAALYCANNDEKINGIIFLAAYPNAKLRDDLSCLSIYGSDDGVLDRKRYETSRQYLPSGTRELVIEGGNHAMFGCYGEQRGDGVAAISQEEQQSQTASAVVELILQ